MVLEGHFGRGVARPGSRKLAKSEFISLGFVIARWDVGATMHATMMRPLAALLLGCFLPAAITPAYILGAFIAPTVIDGGSVEEERDVADDSGPTDEEPAKEPASFGTIALWPSSSEPSVRTLRTAFAGPAGFRPFARGRAGVQTTNQTGPRLERLIAEARCVSRSLRVLAPPVRSHAPPRPA